MYPRTNYEMSEGDLAEILAACKPTPVMFLSGGMPLGPSQQENANAAWAKLGAKMGFDPMTVQAIPGKGMAFFSAVPSETEEARTERLKREAEERRVADMAALESEIEALKNRLTAMREKRHD